MADWQGNTYEYVNRSEQREPRYAVEEVIKSAQSYLRQKEITFEFHLIGSGEYNFVTKVANRDSDFDFDYNLVIQKNNYDENDDAAEIRYVFFEAFEYAINEFNRYRNEYNFYQIEEKKNVLFFECKNDWFSCDLAILLFDGYDKDDNAYYKVLKKVDDDYIWNERNYYYENMYKYRNLVAANCLDELREEYLNLKNWNQIETKNSFSLFYEAINNVYARYNWS